MDVRVAQLLDQATQLFNEADTCSATADWLISGPVEPGSPQVHTAMDLLVQAGLRRLEGVQAVRAAWMISHEDDPEPVEPAAV